MNTLKRNLGIAMLSLTALAVLAVPVTAAEVVGPDGNVIELIATKHGALVNASGMAKVAETQPGVETFSVVIFAEVPDSHRYTIEVTTTDGVFTVDEIDMNIGVGAIKQSNLTHKSKAFPIAEVLGVTISDEKGVVLSGTVPAFSPNG